jgi:hypothetical protein
MTKFISKAQAKKLTGLSYLATISKTVKHKKSIKYGELTYSLYLAPGKTSGYEVCPGRTPECSALCLNESGMNTMTQNIKGDVINRSRITKTRLFFEDPELFMGWLISEINSGITKAKKLGYFFSVRLNNTSDISPEDFVYNGMNILEIFPNIQFYDYTKVAERVALLNVYKNYDLTYSYTGYNWDICKGMLNSGIRVAVVFKKIPTTFMGYDVIDGDAYDMRFHDNWPTIIGLKFKKVRNKLNPNFKFVVQ